MVLNCFCLNNVTDRWGHFWWPQRPVSLALFHWHATPERHLCCKQHVCISFIVCTTNYEYLFVIYVNSIYLVFFKYNEDSGEGLALTRDLTVLTQWVPGLRPRHCQIYYHIILRLGLNPFSYQILYQVMAWRPHGTRPLSDIICITKFSDKTWLVTEILSVTSNDGLKNYWYSYCI